MNRLAIILFISAAFIHFYFFVLQGGYSKGDLSIVYSLARGTGPMLSAVAALVFFGKRPGLLATRCYRIVVRLGPTSLSDYIQGFAWVTLLDFVAPGRA